MTDNHRSMSFSERSFEALRDLTRLANSSRSTVNKGMYRVALLTAQSIVYSLADLNDAVEDLTVEVKSLKKDLARDRAQP